MKIFYTLITEFLVLYLSQGQTTVVTFDSRIEKCQSAMPKSVYEKSYSRDRRSVTFYLKERLKNKSTIVCFLEDGSFKHFDVREKNSDLHRSIFVKNAKNVEGGELIFSRNGISIYDAGENYFVTTKESATVNGKRISERGIVSKWSPMDINGKEIEL